MRYILIGWLGLWFGAVQSTAAQVTLIEAYGDSLTEGLFSQTSLTKPDRKEVADALRDFSLFYLTKEKKYIVPYLRHDLSWVSHLATRLGKSYGLSKPVPVKNFAVAGSQAVDLVKQVARPIPEYNPTVAFFLIGHNDLCDIVGTEWEYVAKFRREYLDALKIWDRTHQDSTAILLPMLPVHYAYERMLDYVWLQEKNEKLTCMSLWRLFGYCPKFNVMAKNGTMKANISPMENALNNELKFIASEMTYTTFTGNRFVTVDPNLFQKPMSGPEFFGFDCYHPSNAGQQAVSSAVYNTLF